MEKPSPQYIKHGWLKKNTYRPDLHTPGNTMEERNIRSDYPHTKFYTTEEIANMRKEIKIAECPICYEKIDNEECRVCENGHKFHNKCSTDQEKEVTKCPLCRRNNEDNNEKIMRCKYNYNDFYSGGKKSKKKNKMTRRKIYKNRKFVKKTNKKSRRARKSRKQ